MVLAAASPEVAAAFIEVGFVALALAGLSRLASRLGITAVPFYLLAGLAIGDGGVVGLPVSEAFIELGAEIGVLLLLLSLGLEYTADELKTGLRTGVVPGVADAALNFTPGLALGLLLGWDVVTAVLLGGITWVSSSGVISKVLNDLNRLGYRETPAILNLLVFEDLAMAVYLPVAGALVLDTAPATTIVTVAIALVVVGAVLTGVLRWGEQLSARLPTDNDETLLLTVFGLTVALAGLAQQLQISGAVGAFLVGLALTGKAQQRASQLLEPLRDLFAAIFFVFFSFQIVPRDLPGAMIPAALLFVVSGLTKLGSGWIAARGVGASPRGRLRAGAALMARGEFSIVIASIGATAGNGKELSTLAGAYVLLSAVIAPLAAKHADRFPFFGKLKAAG